MVVLTFAVTVQFRGRIAVVLFVVCKGLVFIVHLLGSCVGLICDQSKAEVSILQLLKNSKFATH